MTMMHWNKVFLVFLYLDVHSGTGTDDGQMGVDLNLLVISLQLVCESSDAVSCFLLWRFRPLLSICSAIRSGFLNFLFWW